MTAIAAYAVAYAQYELDNGIEPAVDDPLLGDQALEDALASTTKTGEVSPAVLDEAKPSWGWRCNRKDRSNPHLSGERRTGDIRRIAENSVASGVELTSMAPH